MNKSKLLWLNIFCLIFFSVQTEKTEAWSTPGYGFANYLEDDLGVDNTCGVDGIRVQLQLAEYENKNAITSSIPEWSVYKVPVSTHVLTYSWHSIFNGNVSASPSFCYRPSFEKLYVRVKENGLYENFNNIVDADFTKKYEPYINSYGKSYRGYVHLKRQGTIDDWVNVPPTRFFNGTSFSSRYGRNIIFQVRNKNLPAIYGSAGINNIYNYTYDFYTNTEGASEKIITNGGGVGTYLSPLTHTVPDGEYTWFSLPFLNDPANNNNLLVGSVIEYGNLVVDTVPPVITIGDTYNLVDIDTNTVNVDIDNTFSENEESLGFFRRIVIYFEEKDGEVIDSSNITTDVNFAYMDNLFNWPVSTVTNVNLKKGVMYEYYTVATDPSLNTSTSSVKTFFSPCPSGTSYDGSSCVVDSSTGMDLISSNLNTLSGTYAQGDNVTLQAEVYNAGSNPVNNPFNNQFSYSWDNINWTNISSAITHSGLGSGVASLDSVNYNIGQSGNLYYRHCVDVNDDIDEDGNENPNCDARGPYTVTPSVSASLSGTDCDIDVNNVNCGGAITWDIQNSSSPNIYNLTTGTSFSTNNSGINQPILLNHGPNVIQARDGNNVIREITLNVDCNASSAFWHNTNLVCNALPVITIISEEDMIRSGSSIEVSIDILSSFDISCTIYGVETTPSNLNHTGNISTVTHGPIISKSIFSDQIFSVKCTSPTGLDITKDYRIKVIPDYIEI